MWEIEAINCHKLCIDIVFACSEQKFPLSLKFSLGSWVVSVKGDLGILELCLSSCVKLCQVVSVKGDMGILEHKWHNPTVCAPFAKSYDNTFYQILERVPRLANMPNTM